MRIAEVAIDEERPDAEHGQRLRKIDRERGLALAVERGGDLHDLHRLRPHRPLQSKANGCLYHGEDLPQINWEWPKNTWFQEQLSRHLTDHGLAVQRD